MERETKKKTIVKHLRISIKSPDLTQLSIVFQNHTTKKLHVFMLYLSYSSIEITTNRNTNGILQLNISKNFHRLSTRPIDLMNHLFFANIGREIEFQKSHPNKNR